MGGVFAPLNRGFYPPKPVSARLCALCACCHVHTCTHRAETPTPPPTTRPPSWNGGGLPPNMGDPGTGAVTTGRISILLMLVNEANVFSVHVVKKLSI